MLVFRELTGRAAVVLVAPFCYALTSASLFAHDIEVQLLKRTFYVAEPVTVHVSLLGDRDGTGSTRKRPLPRNLDALLYDGDTLVAKAMLAGRRLRASDGGGAGVFMGVFGNITTVDGGGASFALWTTPGRYTVVVAFEEALEPRSDRMPIHILPVPPNQASALHLLKSMGVDLPWAIYGMPNTTEAVNALQELAARHPGTVFGRYGKAALLLTETDWVEGTGQRRRDDSVEHNAVELLEVAEGFDKGHPVRDRLLFRAAGLDMRAGSGRRAEAILEQLLSETRDTWYRTTAERHLAEVSGQREKP